MQVPKYCRLAEAATSLTPMAIRSVSLQTWTLRVPSLPSGRLADGRRLVYVVRGRRAALRQDYRLGGTARLPPRRRHGRTWPSTRPVPAKDIHFINIYMLYLMTRKSRRRSAPGLQYSRTAIRIDNFSRNSEVFSPGAPYWSKLNGWKFHEKSGQGRLPQRLQPQWLSRGHCASAAQQM
jgi:hypothetical protein